MIEHSSAEAAFHLVWKKRTVDDAPSTVDNFSIIHFLYSFSIVYLVRNRNGFIQWHVEERLRFSSK